MVFSLAEDADAGCVVLCNSFKTDSQPILFSMKKIFLSLLTFCALSASAQTEIETFSVYDVNHDAAVTVEDVTKVVNHALKAKEDSPQTVDAAALNALLQSIDARLARIEDKLGIHEPTTTYTVNGVTFDMKLVEAGTFEMGSTSGESDEQPVHTVTISKDYYLGETEVTQALWKAVTGYSPTSNGYSWSSTCGIGDNYPAYYISYNDVQTFITKLNQLTGQTFRMPTEAEWEYAAKGGNKSQGYTYSGSNTISDVTWYSGNSGSKTHPVATKAPNELGIYDMSGNVWEWCSDWYGSYTSTAVSDPTGNSSGSNRVYRGGGWNSSAGSCCVTYRNFKTPSDRYNFLGLRLAL